MFLLGSMALTQSLVIPGLLILKAIDLKGSLVQKIVYTVALSLGSTYFLVLFLTLLGIYNHWLVLVMLLAESFILVWFYRSELKTPASHFFVQHWNNFIEAVRNLISSLEDVKSFSDYIYALLLASAFTLSVVALWWALKLIIYYTGTIFNAWDVVVSWNRWAISWANGVIPLDARNYPQLLPANWSLSYILMGDTKIQFFAKALVLPFTLLTLLMLFDLGMQSRKAGFFLGIIITYLAFKKFIEPQLTNGYADGAMVFFSLLPIYTLIKASSTDNDANRKSLLFLGGIFAGIAAIIKQPGLYIFLIYPILAYFSVIKPFYPTAIKSIKKMIIWSLGISSVIALHWYIFKQVAFVIGLDRPEIFDLTKITAAAHGNVGIISQVGSALSLFEKYILLFPLIFVGVLLLPALYRWLTLLVILPYPILWALIASYDTRNLSILLPILGLTAGLSLESLFQLILKSVRGLKWGKVNLYVLISIIIALSIIANIYVPSSFFYERQATLQKQVFSSSLNARIYKIIATAGSGVRILTNYPVYYLPDLENAQIQFNYKDYDHFLTLIADPSIKYLLVPRSIDSRIALYLDEKISTGDFRILFEDSHWKYYCMIQIMER